MTLVDLLLLLLVAGIIGSIGQAIAGFERGGCLVSIGVGFIGALLGAWLGRQLGAGDLFVLEGHQLPRRVVDHRGGCVRGDYRAHLAWEILRHRAARAPDT